MCIYSAFWIQWEKENLAPYAIHSDHSWYSKRSEYHDAGDDRHGSLSRYRTAFEIDKDRITNSQAFRRLEYKTQVFVTHEGDNFRTRLTHSLEVAEIARHIARSLRLNELLTEAIALGHDLGHAPYGHIAERTINSWLKDLNPPLHAEYYFCHNNHSVENVDYLEPGYDWDDRDDAEGFAQGLNLTVAVREGLLAHNSMGYRGKVHRKARFNKDFEDSIRKLSDSNHEKGLFLPGSLEAQIVKISDDIAQRIHDLEDGLRSGMLNKGDIRNCLKLFFDELRTQMFVTVGNTKKMDIDLLARNDYIEHKTYGTKVCKQFLHHIIEILRNADLLKNKKLPASRNDDINSINSKLRSDKTYQEAFIRAAQVAFLLHMWRDADYLSKLSPGERDKSELRVFKYLKFLAEILDEAKEYPAYHIIAFLRGIMLANVIEHSFWEIHRRLDPKFRTFEASLKRFSKKEDKQGYYVIFVVVDGFTISEAADNLRFEQAEKDRRLYCFKFPNHDEMNHFLEQHFREILSSNGFYLKKLKEDYISNCKIVKRICWLNKSESPDMTRRVKIIGSKTAHVNIDNVRIYFTGYKDLCPGIQQGTCSFGKQRGKNCDSSDCHFWSEDAKYPDITRIVGFQKHMLRLDSSLKRLISEKIHRGSRVVRMNYMGDKIIRSLLDLYLHNPRLMHDRVWARLRTYPNIGNISLPLQKWISKPLPEKEKAVLSDDVFRCLTETFSVNRKCNYFTLVRRIVEHVAGMTDRYISNEYNRMNKSGREVERQDETYFFY